MSRPFNPYIAGNPVGNSAAFVGRDDVLRAVLGVLRDPQHHGIVLYGQRRIGKTSILHHLAEWLPKNGGPRAIYFDLQDKAAWPVGKILAHLAEKIAEELGLPEPEPPEEAEVWFRETWLPPVLAGLPEGGSLAVLFDEFDVLADTGTQKAASDAFFNALRTLSASAAPRLRLVFVIGRNPDELNSEVQAAQPGAGRAGQDQPAGGPAVPGRAGVLPGRQDRRGRGAAPAGARGQSQLCWDGEGSNVGKGNRHSTCPVDTFPKGDSKWNDSALHDMDGNVWEWTSTYYCSYDPKERKTCAKDQYVVRGGSWSDFLPANVRAVRRYGYSPTVTFNIIGFRCARTTQ